VKAAKCLSKPADPDNPNERTASESRFGRSASAIVTNLNSSFTAEAE